MNNDAINHSGMVGGNHNRSFENGEPRGLSSLKMDAHLEKILGEMDDNDSDDDLLQGRPEFKRDTTLTQTAAKDRKRKSPTDAFEELQESHISSDHRLSSLRKKGRPLRETKTESKCNDTDTLAVRISSSVPDSPTQLNKPKIKENIGSLSSLVRNKKPPPQKQGTASNQIRFHRTCSLPKLSKPLSFDEQKERLEKIERMQDRALQKILYMTNFRFSLFPHQFEAVRRAAGVPEDFPLHKGSKVKSPLLASIRDAVVGLKLEVNQPTTRGLCIADCMGLGKTVEAIGGAILSDAIATERGEKKLPILVVSPNDAVQLQWRDTLLLNGVPMSRIVWFKKGMTKGFESNNFILLTRHTAAAEIRRVFDERSKNTRIDTKEKPSPLFPQASRMTLERLQDEYLFEKGKSRRTWKKDGEMRDDTITRLIANCKRKNDRRKIQHSFRMVVIDEAHFLKNRITFWTYACSLSSIHAHRVVPLTGTPYNNGSSDLGTLMTMIDPSKKSASSQWWKRCLGSKSSTRAIIESTKTWHENFMLRRGKEAIAHLLPQKIVTRKMVAVSTNDLDVYCHYEAKLVHALKDFNKMLDANNPIHQAKLKNLFQIVMSFMSCMRSSLIHPLLPSHGREVTKLFSPTRCQLVSPKEVPQFCVCCQQGLRPSVPVVNKIDKPTPTKQSNGTSQSNNIDEMEEGEDYNDDMAEEEYEIDDRPLFPLPPGICGARKPIQHYAHQECIDLLSMQYIAGGCAVSCPRCLDLQGRATGTHNGAVSSQKFWCKDVVPSIPKGFATSPKLDAVIKWILDVPKCDKILVVSFFKGSLDLVEAILMHEFGWNVARFDGDVSPTQKTAELERFKHTEDCRVLLMTVQSGGVGLNVVEGNHIAFLDRWFNPFVHDQAEDRCFRLGQKKDVSIHYFDVGATVDEVMFQINKVKQENSKVVLASGEQIGTETGTLSYTEMSGLVSRLITAIRDHRTSFLAKYEKNNSVAIPSYEGIKGQVEEHKQKMKDNSSVNGKSQQQKPEDGNDSPPEKPPKDEDGLDDASFAESDDEWGEKHDATSKIGAEPETVKSEMKTGKASRGKQK